jgi:hypothetical protein
MIAVTASTAIREPPPPVSLWDDAPTGTGGGQPVPLEGGRQFATVRIDTMVSYIRYLFEQRQAVILPDGSDYWFFFAYNDNGEHVRTTIFDELDLLAPAQWDVTDVWTQNVGGQLRYVIPSAYWDGTYWYPEVCTNTWPGTGGATNEDLTYWFLDEGSLGVGLWTPPIDVGGAADNPDWYLPLTAVGPNNVVYMDGQTRAYAAWDDWHIFKSFDGWTGTEIIPMTVVFPEDLPYSQGYENTQLLYRNGRLVIVTGGYRGPDYSLPTNPLLAVFRQSTDGGATWGDTTWVDQSFVADIPGEYPGIDGHWSNSFFGGLIDQDGDLHILMMVVDYGCFNNTSYVHGMYDVHEEYGAWTATMVCDGTYQVTPDSIWDPRTELLAGDTHMHSPSLAEGEDGTLFAAWADYGFYDGVTSTLDIWLTRSHDGGATWLPPVRITDTTGDNEYFPRLVPATTDSFAYALTMYNNDDGPMDMIQVPVDFEVVPVELASLTARPVGESVLVAWETRSERDNLGFNVERSDSRAGAYERLNDVLIPGAGMTSEPRTYSYVDESAEPGHTYWYRLEDVSASGERTLHGPVQVMVPGASGLTLQVLGGTDPSFRMQFTRGGGAALSLYDIRGSRAATVWAGEAGEGEARTVRMSADIGSGLYTAKLTQGERSVTRKLVLAR